MKICRKHQTFEAIE